ncbi:hypothetical protein IPC8_09535 [Pseudomonas aeruginosa]|nr:hypothetical protein IPC8_09535 [Pseudomonas aeruginosa]
MKAITPDQSELIEAVLAELDVGLLTASILEKDIHVTDAMEYPVTHPVFCGGNRDDHPKNFILNLKSGLGHYWGVTWAWIPRLSYPRLEKVPPGHSGFDGFLDGLVLFLRCIGQHGLIDADIGMLRPKSQLPDGEACREHLDLPHRFVVFDPE